MTLTDIHRAPVVAPPPAPAAPHILFVVRGAESYGTETKMLGLLDSMTSRGLRASLFALGDGHLVEMARRLPGLAVHVDPTAPPRFETGSVGRGRAFARTMAASTAWMRRLRAFLAGPGAGTGAMAICEHGLALPIGAVARGSGVPAFWIMANGVSGTYRFDLNRRLYEFAFRHLNLIPVANSEYTRTTLGRGAQYAAKIDLGVNPARLALHTAPTLPIGDDFIRLLVMSRLVAGKGHKVLLQAILGSPEFADIHLIIGGGPLGSGYAQDLQREAEVHGAAGRLHLLGPVTDVAGHYAAADVVVNARLDPEPFGLSIVEAMLMGKPILAHAAGGPKEIVQDGVTGWHITAPTVEAFADGLRRMLRDRAHWPRMGNAGRLRARRHYTHHSMTDQFLDVVTSRLKQ